MKNLMRTASLFFSPTAICLLDADEFIVCSSRDLFRTRLLSLNGNTVGYLLFQSYIPLMHIDNPAERNVLRRITHRRRCEDHQWVKAIVPKKIHSNPNTNIEVGNHDVILDTYFERHYFSDIRLAHYPVRTSDQIQKKIVVNWLSVLAMGGHQHGMAWHWEKYYHDFKKSNYTEVDISHIANHYSALAPSDLVMAPVESLDLPLDITARFAENSLLKAVVDFAEQLINHQLTIGHLARGSPFPQTSTPISAWNYAWLPEMQFVNNYVDFPPFEYVYNLFRPHSALEIGASHGRNLQRIRDMGARRVLGVEGQEFQKVYPEGIGFMKHDLREPLDLREMFDLVVCTEVIDRLPSSSSSVLVDSIVRHASNVILFSAARIGQSGENHINCVPIRHWITEFGNRGWVPLVFHSLAFRSSATISWLRANPVLFVREGTKNNWQYNNFNLADLENQERIPWNWTEQKAGYYWRPHLGDEMITSWA
jgi:hypothetical protein